MADTEKSVILRMSWLDLWSESGDGGLFHWGASSFSRFLGNVSDPDFRSIYPDQLAAPKGQSSGGKHQEEFLGLQDVKRSLDFQPCAGFRNVEQKATSTPCAVDAEEVDRIALFETNPICLSIAVCHQRDPAAATALPVRTAFETTSLTDP
jgi:hypothetical protein